MANITLRKASVRVSIGVYVTDGKVREPVPDGRYGAVIDGIDGIKSVLVKDIPKLWQSYWSSPSLRILFRR